MYVAHAAQLTDAQPSSRGLNYSALARKLHIADGSTVKTHLTRFEERFVKPTAPRQDESCSSEVG